MDALGNFRQALTNYDAKGAAQGAQSAIAEGTDPLALVKVMMETMREIGDRFGCGDLFLPDLIGAANAAQAALPILEQEIQRRGQTVDTLGTVIIGTVYGDIHSIGKSMVSTMLSSRGFRVIDLGTNVAAETFVKAVQENHADILALSALLTTTMVQQAKVIQALKSAGLRDRLKIMVGGGAITAEFAKSIGADGYGATAPEAVDVARTLLNTPNAPAATA